MKPEFAMGADSIARQGQGFADLFWDMKIGNRQSGIIDSLFHFCGNDCGDFVQCALGGALQFFVGLGAYHTYAEGECFGFFECKHEWG